MKLALSLLLPALLSAGVHPIFERADAPPPTPVDRLLAAQWQKLGIQPANPCSDAVFLRRAYLDVTGSIPTAAEAAAFLQHPDRPALVDRLLASDRYAAYYAMRWSDLLRVKAEFPVNLWPNAAQAYYHWIRASLAANKPYDQFARELLTASGSNFRDPPVNFYRALQSRDPLSIAQTVAQTFLGTPTPPAGMAAAFTQIRYKETKEWKEEIVYSAANPDPREALAASLLQDPAFPRTIVNRIWSWLQGQDLDNPEVLDYLAKQLIANHYDLKSTYRTILNTNTYQLSPIPVNGPAAAVSRLDAEVLADALNLITGTTDSYTSAIPEPYTFMPDDQRAVDLPDGSITNAFLDLFGKPARDTGLPAERNNRITDAQRLHLLNSTNIQRKLQQIPRMSIDQLYLTILSRYPSPDERKLAQSSIRDLPWALVNSTEFLCRH